MSSVINRHLTFLCENSAFSGENELRHMSGEEKFTKPQGETVLINLAYIETGISAHFNHMLYGTFSMCTCLAAELIDTPTVNQSFIELSNIFFLQTQHRSHKMTGLHMTARKIFDNL